MRGGCRKSAASSMRNQRGERERAAPNSAAPPCFAIYTPQLPKKTEAQKHSGPARCSVLWGYARVVYPTREKALGLVLPALGAFFPCFFSRQANSPKTRSVGSARPPLGLRAASWSAPTKHMGELCCISPNFCCKLIETGTSGLLCMPKFSIALRMGFALISRLNTTSLAAFTFPMHINLFLRPGFEM